MARRQQTGQPRDSDQCEVAELGTSKLYTFHTHPHGKATPSGLDKQTSIRMGNKLMCIGLAPSGKIICYDTTGRKVVGSFSP